MTESRLDRITENTACLLEEIAALANEAGTKKFSMLAVTKNQPEEAICAAYQGGARVFGENRVQSYLQKSEFFQSLSGSEIHMIGYLQKNKVKGVVGNCRLIESVDSCDIAEKIGQRAVSLGITQDILLEVNVGYDGNKFGFLPEELENVVNAIARIQGVSIKGMMTIPPIAAEKETEKVFEAARKLFIDMKEKKIDNVIMQFLSMGMSNDYQLAIKHGANIVRLGRIIFN